MILVFIEHKNCVLNKTSLEAIAAAQSIGEGSWSNSIGRHSVR